MSFVILFASCSQYDDSSEIKSTIINDENLSGEDIFKGLFFFQNESFNNNISYLNEINSTYISNSKETLENLKKISDISINYIKETNPHFFDELKSSIYSKNLYDIETIMGKSAVLVEESLLNSKEYSKIMLSSSLLKHNKSTMKKLNNLDPENEFDMVEIQKIADDYLADNNQESALVGIFYALGAVVSIGAVIYSVVNWVAYWDAFSKTEAIQDDNSLTKDEMMVDINNYFVNQTL